MVLHARMHTFSILLLKSCCDEERIAQVCMLSNLDGNLWYSKADLVKQPLQGVVIYSVCEE